MLACPRIRHYRIALVSLATLALLSGSAALAQQAPAPRVEIFGGYSYIYPNATLTGTQPGGIAPISTCMCSIPKGAGAAITYDFNRWLGITADWSGHWSPKSNTPSLEFGHADLFTYSAGPKFTYRTNHFAPFAEAMIGEQHLAPELFTADTKFGVIAGGGLDWMPTRHFGIRLAQADFVMSNHHFGVQSTAANTDLRAVRLQAGVVFTFGNHYRAIVMPEPAPAPVVIAPVAAVVAAPAPLTIVCSANPSSILVGDSSTITANATSTRPLTYSYSASAGMIDGTGTAATLTTAGIPPETVEVTCKAVDDLGATASQTIPVIVAAPVVAPVVPVSNLCTISFDRDPRRPTRVDNEAKACLDDVALSLQRSADAQLILVGYASSSYRDSTTKAAERAVNTKAYLVDDKGIESGRIIVYTGSGDRNEVTIMLVPAGATPDLSADAPVDESTVKVRFIRAR